MLETFLELNGAGFPISDEDDVVTMLRLAAGELTDDEFIVWVRVNMRATS